MVNNVILIFLYVYNSLFDVTNILVTFYLLLGQLRWIYTFLSFLRQFVTVDLICNNIGEIRTIVLCLKGGFNSQTLLK